MHVDMSHLMCSKIKVCLREGGRLCHVHSLTCLLQISQPGPEDTGCSHALHYILVTGAVTTTEPLSVSGAKRNRRPVVPLKLVVGHTGLTVMLLPWGVRMALTGTCVHPQN